MIEAGNFFYMEDLDCPPLSDKGAYKKLVEWIVDLELAIAEDRGVDQAWLWITPESFV